MIANDEVVVGHCLDPDFGALSLIETQTMAALNGGPMQPLVYRSWRGTCAELGGDILVSSNATPPSVSDDARRAYRAVLADPHAFIEDIARRQIGLARDWAASGGRSANFDTKAFAAMLMIDGFSVDPGRLTVWLKDTKDIFAGHVLEVRFEGGGITEIVLAG